MMSLPKELKYLLVNLSFNKNISNVLNIQFIKCARLEVKKIFFLVIIQWIITFKWEISSCI